MRKLWLVLAYCCVLGGVVWVWHPKPSSSLQYISSERCRSCHLDQYRSWQSSLHSKMFYPVKSDADILGDFTSDNPALTFSKEDVQFVVGSRWEQIYARIIDGEYYPLPAKWHVKQQQWVPYKVDTWHKTPMSLKCNGCHTTGFQPETHKFSEFSIGCEACHGPGAEHATNEEMVSHIQCKVCHFRSEKAQHTIIRSVSSTVCGQCHSRGKNTPNSTQEGGIYNFPLQYTPGENLGQAMAPIEPSDDKQKKFWWGNGIAKARHQEFADWEKSNHSQALRRMVEQAPPQNVEIKGSCLECHCTDYMLSPPEKRPHLDTATFGVTCVGCHDPHQVSPDPANPRPHNQPCLNCHNQENKCPGNILSHPRIPCDEKSIECVDCHMPYVVKSGGWFSIRGHGFQIVTPEEGNLQSMPHSCQNGQCHIQETKEWAVAAYEEMVSDKGKQP